MPLYFSRDTHAVWIPELVGDSWLLASMHCRPTSESPIAALELHDLSHQLSCCMAGAVFPEASVWILDKKGLTDLASRYCRKNAAYSLQRAVQQ